MTEKIAVQPCDFGLGVFATRRFEAGERILRFEGPVITRQEAIAKGSRSMNPLQIGAELYIDTLAPGVFVNHCCNPNAGLRSDIFLVALRPIETGEQICFDYSTSMAEGLETMDCNCGATNCRGVVKDFSLLPKEEQSRYLAFKAVQTFIAYQYSSQPEPLLRMGGLPSSR